MITDQLTIQRDALVEEIACLKQSQQTELESVRAETEKSLQALEERLKKDREHQIQQSEWWNIRNHTLGMFCL